MVRIKVCGITNKEDALNAIELGAHALGFVFAPSPRQIDPEKAGSIIKQLPPWVSTVGVFVNEKQEKILQVTNQANLDWIQLHGEESPEFCRELGLKIIKTIKIEYEKDINRVSEYPVSGILLDTFDKNMKGGSGRVFNWDLAVKAKKYKKPIILAGGLESSNVLEAISKVMPYGIEVNSGIESSPGKKDFEKMKKFFNIVKSEEI